MKEEDQKEDDDRPFDAQKQKMADDALSGINTIAGSAAWGERWIDVCPAFLHCLRLYVPLYTLTNNQPGLVVQSMHQQPYPASIHIHVDLAFLRLKDRCNEYFFWWKWSSSFPFSLLPRSLMDLSPGSVKSSSSSSWRDGYALAASMAIVRTGKNTVGCVTERTVLQGADQTIMEQVRLKFPRYQQATKRSHAQPDLSSLKARSQISLPKIFARVTPALSFSHYLLCFSYNKSFDFLQQTRSFTSVHNHEHRSLTSMT